MVQFVNLRVYPWIRVGQETTIIEEVEFYLGVIYYVLELSVHWSTKLPLHQVNFCFVLN